MPTLSAIFHGIERDQPKFDVRLSEPTTYLKTLDTKLGIANQKIVLAFKQSTVHASQPTKASAVAPRRKPKEVQHELTGTPLEDDCEIDAIDESLLNTKLVEYQPWTDDEESMLPITVDESRQLMNHINRYDCDQGSVWCLCQSPDEPDTIMQQWEYDESWHTRGIVKFTGHLNYGQIDIVKLLHKHSSYLSGPTSVATYIQTQFIIQPFLTMQLSWNSTSPVPSLSSNRNADILLFQTVRVGNNASVADDYWRQLMRLDQIKRTIVEFKEDEDRNVLVYASGSGLSLSTIREGILRVLSDVTPILTASGDNISFELEPVIKQSLGREMVDITDQLWMLLKLCSSYEDLKTAFVYIFQCAAKCNVVNLPMNQNRLAELIREISQKRLAVPCLTGAEPLELLLEIGLEKANKDYEYIFTESKICSPKDLATAAQPLVAKAPTSEAEAAVKRQTLMLRNHNAIDEEATDSDGFQNSTFNRAKSEKEIDRLAHIHLLMEHLLLIQIHLNWSDMRNYVLEDLKRPSKSFDTLKILMQDKREIPILCSNVISKVERREPNLLKIVMQSANKFSNVQNTFVYSTSPILPINVFPMMQCEEKNPLIKTIYCGLHYLKIGTIKQMFALSKANSTTK